ncbi:MAG: NAD-dependent epimerase/dehydratase family protein [Gemmatimonadota bacterium]
MTRLLVTGADGFVGRHLVRTARADGHQVIAAVLPGTSPIPEWTDAAVGPIVEVVRADLTRPADLDRLARVGAEAIVHLAAIASGAAARHDPAGAMQVNSVGSLQLLQAFAAAGERPRLLFVSTGEVYGPGHDGPIPESAPLNPVSPYAESKRAAEAALAEVDGEGRVPTIIVRAFPHSGPGQSAAYVLPALAARLRAAKAAGDHAVTAGNLDPVRDFLDVRDVARAYLVLLDRGVAGEVYNVASGTGQRLRDCFDRLAELIGVEARPTQDPALMRPADIPVLIGDPRKLRAATDWTPQYSFDQTLQDLVDAQAH